MVDHIEVYVEKRKQIVRQYVTPPMFDGYQHHACMSKEVTDHEEVLPEADAEALKTVEQLAAEVGISFKTYNVSDSVGKLRAKLNGVTKTPTVIVNGEKIEKVSIELLKSKLHT